MGVDLMKISYQMVLEQLGLKYTELAGRRNPKIYGVELYTSGCDDSNMLYVATLEDALRAPVDKKLAFLCVHDNGSAVHPKTEHTIAIVSDVDVTDLANVANFAYLRLVRWLCSMQQSVIDQDGVQALLNISEDIMVNTVTVLDSSLKLLAYTRNHLPDDEPNVFLIENGYHSEKTLKKLRQFERFKEPSNTNDIVISEDRSISDYITVKKFFKHFNNVFVYVVMICNRRSVTRGLIDQFELLNFFIEFYTKKGYPYDGKYSAFDSLMHDILDMHLKDESEIRQRVDAANFPYNGIFDFYKIDIAANAVQAISFLTLKLSGMITNSKVTFYRNSIIVLNTYRNTGELEERYREICGMLEMVASDSIEAVGISNCFFNLSGFHLAFHQAEAATELGAIAPELNFALEKSLSFPVCKFEDVYLKHMCVSQLSSEAAELYENNIASILIKRLDEFSKIRSYNYLDLLYTYLLLERRATDVAEAVHLHRNTIIYHIEKIEELFGASLEDPQLRLKLLVEIYRHKMSTKS